MTRLPLNFPFEARETAPDKDSSLTNALKTSDEGRQLVELRPGTVITAQVAGAAAGNGLVCFGGELVSIFGANLCAGIIPGEGGGDILSLPLENSLVEEANGFTITPTGGSQGFVAGTVCGDYVYEVTGVSSYLNVQSALDFMLHDSDWTFELYFKSAGDTVFFVLEDGSGFNRFAFGVVGGLFTLEWYNEDDYDVGVSVGGFSVNTWTHVAWVMEHISPILANVTLYINGTAVNTSSAFTYCLLQTDGGGFTVKVANGPGLYKGVSFHSSAKYTGNFTPTCPNDLFVPSVVDTVQNSPYDFAQSSL